MRLIYSNEQVRDMPSDRSQQIRQTMRDGGVPDVFIEVFLDNRARALSGDIGEIGECDITPVSAIADANELQPPAADEIRAAMEKTVMIKLNGGLGTGMGLEQAKSLLPVRDGLSFLDIIVRQAETDDVPLVLMNSEATEADSLAVVGKRVPANAEKEIPYSFLQHRQPKLTQPEYAPVSWPAAPQHESCPPGHGDLFVALRTSRILDRLLESGCEYAFVSNADNLGAVIDPSILVHFVQSACPFLMEVADRTDMDRKGGHLAVRRRDGRLILRESAQCPADDVEAFQDVQRHRFFNTNNLWLRLRAVRQLLDDRNNQLRLPLIRNAKPVDPRDPESTTVYQLETAMGAAIEVFADAAAIRVPRTRFAPVKTTEDLLLVRSDAYVLTHDGRVLPAPNRQAADTTIRLDPRYYRFLDDLDARFPFGPPSLSACTSLSIEGDVRFGRNVVCRGHVKLASPRLSIPDEATIGTVESE